LTASYLSVLDAVIGAGTALLSKGLREAVVASALRFAATGGGFRGRRGEADPYYTDFGLRLIALLRPTHPFLSATVRSLPALCAGPREVVDAFGALNCRRVLAGLGLPCEVDLCAVRGALSAQRLPAGGYRRRGTEDVSAYATFLAALCHDMLDEPFPDEELAARKIAALQGAAGGFQEQPGQGPQQTNATAAATAFLSMAGALSPEALAGAASFLAAAQGPDGGLRAHPGAAHGDLLSSFTGLVALVGLGEVGRLDLSALARFVRGLVTRDGGFAAWPDSGETDVEYLYYGLGCLAIVAGIAQSS
jgi:geranylgeranyl transferase type-2 subunit beta